MGYNQRNDEIRDNSERMRRDREAYCVGDRSAIQRAPFGQEDRVVLADDCRRAHVKTSLAYHRLR
jgi:hypothetical protein